MSSIGCSFILVDHLAIFFVEGVEVHVIILLAMFHFDVLKGVLLACLDLVCCLLNLFKQVNELKVLSFNQLDEFVHVFLALLFTLLSLSFIYDAILKLAIIKDEDASSFIESHVWTEKVVIKAEFNTFKNLTGLRVDH